MCAIYKDKDIEVDGDDPSIVASHLYDLHGYKKALSIVSHYISDAKNASQRFEWQCVVKELAQISITDTEIRTAGLG